MTADAFKRSLKDHQDKGFFKNLKILRGIERESLRVSKKGRISQSVAASVNTTGITYANTNAAGTASGSFAHLPNQKIHISSSAPANNDIGNNGDIWYQTL